MLCFLALAFLFLLFFVYTYLLHKAAVKMLLRKKVLKRFQGSSRGMLFGAITGAFFFGIIGGYLGGLLIAVTCAISAGIIGGALGMVAFEKIALCWNAIFGGSNVKPQQVNAQREG